MLLTPFWLGLGPFLSAINQIMHFSYRGAESSKEEKKPSFSEHSEIKVHLAVECSPGTKHITERQLLKASHINMKT